MTAVRLAYIISLTVVVIFSGTGAAWLSINGHRDAGTAAIGITGVAVGALVGLGHRINGHTGSTTTRGEADG